MAPENISYPVFDGENLPLLNDYLKEIQQLFTQVGLPVSRRGKVIAQSVKGKAHFILQHSSLGKDPSFEDQVEILFRHFGETSIQMELIQNLHSNIGPIPTTLDPKISTQSIYTIVNQHISLIKSLTRLQNQVGEEQKKGTVITKKYLNHLEQFLPRDKIENLYLDIGYSSLRNDIRFQRINDAYQRIKAFSMDDLAKNGNGSEFKAIAFNPRIPPPSFVWNHSCGMGAASILYNPKIPPPSYYA